MIKLHKSLQLIAVVLAGLLVVAGCASSPTRESTGQYLDNSGVTAAVKANLLADSKVSSFPITVNTYKGTVQLSGFVDNYAQKVRAERIARGVQGVKAIDNALVVRTTKR